MPDIKVLLNAHQLNFDLLIVDGRPAIGDGKESYAFISPYHYISKSNGMKYVAKPDGWADYNAEKTICEEVNIYNLVWIKVSHHSYSCSGDD